MPHNHYYMESMPTSDNSDDKWTWRASDTFAETLQDQISTAIDSRMALLQELEFGCDHFGDVRVHEPKVRRRKRMISESDDIVRVWDEDKKTPIGNDDNAADGTRYGTDGGSKRMDKIGTLFREDEKVTCYYDPDMLKLMLRYQNVKAEDCTEFTAQPKRNKCSFRISKGQNLIKGMGNHFEHIYASSETEKQDENDLVSSELLEKDIEDIVSQDLETQTLPYAIVSIISSILSVFLFKIYNVLPSKTR